MKIQTVNWRMSLLACGLTLLALASFVMSSHFSEQRRLALQHRLDNTLAAVEMGQASDQLTASVRAYAATLDPTCREAFQTELLQTRRRERALETIRRTGDSYAAGKIEAAKRESDALLAVEARIFELAAAGQREPALALAYGSSYAQAKARIRAHTDATIAAITQRSAAEIARADRWATGSQLLAIATILLNSAALLWMLLGYYQRRIVKPLMTTSAMLRRFDAGDRSLHFGDPEAAYELRELGEMLEAHAGVVGELEQQRLSLLLSDQQQRAIFNAATSGIIFVKGHGTVDCNERLAELIGRPRAEIIGQPTAAVFGEVLEPDEFARIREAPRAGRTYRAEIQLRRADGHAFWGRLSGQALDAGHPDRGSVWVVDDISAEHAAAERMVQAKSLAEDAVRTKASFLANMSHEIRTPMNAIIGMAHLLRRTQLDSRQADYLRRMDVSSQHLLSLLNDVLDLSKIEAGHMTVDSTAFELEQMCERVCTVMAGEAAAKGLELLLHIASGVPPSLLGDPMRLSQILLNYVNNAVKFTQAGQIVIFVTAQDLQGGDWALRFEVRDTGIGLSAEQCARLFQNFGQVDASTTRRYGGTGLGLSIAKSLSTLMGGEVGVDSQLGVGSTFWFTARMKACAGSAARTLEAPKAVGQRVLLVDDNASARVVLEDLLVQQGREVIAVASGQAALAELREAQRSAQAFSLALIDWRMPDMDGIELVRAMRALQLSAPPTPILLSAFGPTQLRGKAREIGVEWTLTKPITMTALREAMEAALLGVAQDSSRSASGAGMRWSGRRVLLAEDNENNQIVARELLEGFGLRVDVVGDGAQAVRQLDLERYDLVLMDLHMPVMDGIEAMRHIRQRPKLARLPILALTSSAMSQDRQRCLLAGMDDHIAKPVQPDVLQRKLQQWLALSGIPVAAAEREEASAPASVSVAHAGMPEIMAQIEAALRRNDFTVRQQFLRHQAPLKDLLGSTYASLHRAIDELDFDAARRLWPSQSGLEASAAPASEPLP